MIKEIENKIGQLQYEISCLGLDKEDLSGVSIRTEELKDLVKKIAYMFVPIRNAQDVTMSKHHSKKYLQAKYVAENPKGYDERDVLEAKKYCDAYMDGYNQAL